MQTDYRQRVKIPIPIHRELKSWAALRGMTIQAALVEAIRQLIDDQQPPPPATPERATA